MAAAAELLPKLVLWLAPPLLAVLLLAVVLLVVAVAVAAAWLADLEVCSLPFLRSAARSDALKDFLNTDWGGRGKGGVGGADTTVHRHAMVLEARVHTWHSRRQLEPKQALIAASQSH